MAEETEQAEEKEKPKQIKKKNLWFRISAGAFLAISVLVLIVYKTQNPEFQLRNVFLIAVGLLIIGIGIFFSSELWHFFRKKRDKDEDETKLPKPASPEEMKQILKSILEAPKQVGGYENHIKYIAVQRPRDIGNNNMYHFRIVPLYRDRDPVSGKIINHFDFMFNAHYPEPAIDVNLSNTMVKSVLNSMSKNKEDIPDVEESVSFDPLSGREVRYRKTSKKKKEKEAKKEASET
jgi:hypothetical protein